jgi:hypothetical protein
MRILGLFSSYFLLQGKPFHFILHFMLPDLDNYLSYVPLNDLLFEKYFFATWHNFKMCRVFNLSKWQNGWVFWSKSHGKTIRMKYATSRQGYIVAEHKSLNLKIGKSSVQVFRCLIFASIYTLFHTNGVYKKLATQNPENILVNVYKDLKYNQHIFFRLDTQPQLV